MSIYFNGKPLANLQRSAEPRVVRGRGDRPPGGAQQPHAGREPSTSPPASAGHGTSGSTLGNYSLRSQAAPTEPTGPHGRGRSPPAPFRPSATPLLVEAHRGSPRGTYPLAREPRARAGSPVRQTLLTPRRRCGGS